MFGNMIKLGRKKISDERRVIQFIRTSLKQREIPPTVREVASYFNISVSTAHSYLKSLRNKKLLKIRKVQNKNKTVARGIGIKR